jgi:hypothetical protein
VVYNGHFGCICYHPLFVFNQLGDLERCALRPGNVHSADGWPDELEPVVSRYRDRMQRLYFRGDAAFAMPEIFAVEFRCGVPRRVEKSRSAGSRRMSVNMPSRPLRFR